MADAAEWEADQERSWGADEVGAGDVDADLDRRPDHAPQLHRAMSEAAADLDAVDDRLSTLFDRTEGPARGEVLRTTPAPEPVVDDDTEDELFDLFDEVDVDGDGDADGDAGEADDDIGRVSPVVADRMAIIGEYEDDIGGAFAELDAELAAEEPDERGPEGKRRRFGRRAKGTTAARA
jgi:hypothetical protein